MKLVPVLIAFLVIGFFIGKNTTFTVAPADSSEEIAALKNKIAELEKQLSAKPAAVAPPQVQTRIAESLPTTPQAPPVQAPQDSPPPEPQAKPNPNKWLQAEKTIPNLRNPGDIAKFLERAEIADFLKEVQNLKPITEPSDVVDSMNGNFVGLMTSNSTTASFNIAMDARLSVKDQQLKGRVSLRLSRNGKVFSRGTNNGDIQNVQQFSEKSQSVLVSTGDFYFQLYYIPGTETFDGNCYQQIKPGVMQLVGTVHLDRVQ